MPSTLRLSVLSVHLALAPLALAAPPATKPAAVPAPRPADPLPADFAGWQRTAPPQISTDPAVADAKNVPVLKEYGFNQLATANYTNGDNKLSIRELRFADATGAYGAFTFYRVPGTSPEEIGKEGDANGSHVIFWTGSTMVDAVFDHLTVMSASALRELADDIPPAAGAKNIPPPLPGYLPVKDREVTYTRYALGPESYARSGGVLPPALVDFNRGAEVLTGTFHERNGDGQLTLIEYPTPQLAIERERAISAFLKAGPPAAPAAGPAQAATPQPATPQPASQPAAPNAWPMLLNESNTQALMTRRSGPIVAVTSGAFDDADARALINMVHYEASVSWSRPEQPSEPNKAARLLVGAITLSIILGSIAILLGLFFGGGRALVRRLQGKSASTVHEAEFIKLDLK
jgi:hypothetical protein